MPLDSTPRTSSGAAAAISAHATNWRYRWDLQAANLNSGCQLPGDLFAAPLTLTPNPPLLDDVRATFGPIALPEGFDTITFLVRSTSGRTDGHSMRLALEILDHGSEPLASATLVLAAGEDRTATLSFEPPVGEPARISLGLRLGFERFDDDAADAGVELYYLLAYTRNVLIDLCNRAGTDKGTEVHFGGGVPHCY